MPDSVGTVSKRDIRLQSESLGKMDTDHNLFGDIAPITNNGVDFNFATIILDLSEFYSP